MRQVLALLPFVRPYWRRAVAALLLLSVLVVFDLAIPRLIQVIIDQGIAAGDQAVVLQTALLMLGLSATSTLIAIGNNYLSVFVGESFARDLRDALFARIQSFAYADLDRQSTGQLLVRLTSDIAAVRQVIQVSLRIGTRAPLLIIGSLILMFQTSPSLALSLLPLLAVTLVIIIVFSVRMEPLFRTVQEKLDGLNTVLQENTATARLIKAFVRADHEGQRFESANQAYTGVSVRVMQIMATLQPALTLCVNIGMVIVIWAGGLQAIQGELSLGQIVAFTNYLTTTMGPLMLMVMLANMWASGIASAKRIDEVLATDPAIQDAPDAVALPAGSPGRLVFERVSFAYGVEGAEPVLADIDLVVEPGQTVALLGATGAGKSTLVNLVPRFYDASAGRILLDGVDVRQLRQEALLARIGIVPQETVLFAGTVADNLRYGAPAASEADMLAAARAAQAHDFIVTLPQGYETRVEERGVNLSGGQKQRIAIARALLMQPQILILDDSTSAVDVETETRIQHALWSRDGGRARPTSLVVAQRISTVLTADKIVVLDRGRIVAEGDHAGLLRTSPIYREIYESQLGAGVNGGGREA
jgi:ATP-binding cassette subfamily B protein